MASTNVERNQPIFAQNQYRNNNASLSPPTTSSPSTTRQTKTGENLDLVENDTDISMKDEINEREIAEAAAQVSTLQEGNNENMQRGRGRGRGPSAAVTRGEEAVIGAPGEGISGFEVVDRAGELVRLRFQGFLSDFYEEIDPDESNETKEDDSISIKSPRTQKYYPYLEQISTLAKHLSNTFEEDDEEESFGLKQTLLVNHAHLRMYGDNGELAEALDAEYMRFEPFLRRAVRSLLAELYPHLDLLLDASSPVSTNAHSSRIYVSLYNLPQTIPVRQLRTDQVGRLCSISGTVTRTSDVRPELLIGAFRCTKCGLLAENIQQQYVFTRPTTCRNPRCNNQNPTDFVLDCGPKSEFIDWQKLRVQENSHEIPPGSMPRSLDVVLRGEMVERAKAGDVCVFTGSLVVIPDASALARAGESAIATKEGSGGRGGNGRNGGMNEVATGGGGGVRGLKALGVRELTYRTCFVVSSVLPADVVARGDRLTNFFWEHHGGVDFVDQTPQDVAMELTPAERDDIRAMKSSPQLYSHMVNSIAPRTFGHLEVKRGILLMLLGGVHKTTPEGMRLRGDINVCIVGDPSTAKSQFLKYIHAFLPSRAVYTSGKASSAAGLTASVQRDQDTGEFCIEAGALMLADNGVCCIDEFDKMDPSDQVAIHEAMEQQTISITKAGIQATLNARASILAAANPIYGRYDRSKTLKANVALSAPILSRFDLFFVILDECDELADYKVAKHILDVHRCEEEAVQPPFSRDQMQRYIRFARTLTPVITPESQKVFVECYRKLRQGDVLGRSRTAYRITVRQLESMIRLSEALARLHCDDEVKPTYVREAFRLLKKSIIHVETEDITFDDEDDGGMLSPQGEDQGDTEDNNDEGMNRSEPLDQSNRDSLAQPSSHAGEYNGNDEDAVPPHNDFEQKQPPLKSKKKKKSKKTQITYEEYESISNAISTYLRSKEGDHVANADLTTESSSDQYLTWGDTVEWYLEQCEEQIGSSEEELDRLKKLTNLVVRRLINVDRVLIYIGQSDGIDEEKRTIAVHPNYVVS